MKHLTKIGFIFGLSVSSNVFSLNPVQGLYLAPLAEISVVSPAPSVTFSANQLTHTSNVTLNPLGGGFGIALGYRMDQVRLEGELLFNIIGYDKLQLGSCRLVTPDVLGPQGNCADPYLNDNGIGFSGNATSGYALFNVFYDFMSSTPESAIFPYLGVGLGGAYVRSTAKFQSNEFSGEDVSFNSSSSKSSFAAQGIVGFGYYMDDYATIGLDFRYLSAFSTSTNSNTSSSNASAQFGIASINLVGTFALEKTK